MEGGEVGVGLEIEDVLLLLLEAGGCEQLAPYSDIARGRRPKLALSETTPLAGLFKPALMQQLALRTLDDGNAYTPSPRDLSDTSSSRLPPCSARTSTDAMDFLCTLWQHENPEQTLLALDSLCSCEEAIVAIVTEAQASVAAARASHATDRSAALAATEDALSRQELPTIETACAAALTPRSSSGGFTPFWAEVCGTLRLVRAEYNLKSPEVCRLDTGALVRVHQVRKTLDGVWRGEVSLAGGLLKPLGWMTLIPKDGSENMSYVFPQPADDKDEPRIDGEPTGGTGFLVY